MKKFQYLSFLATLAIGIGMISWGGVLHAQTSPSTTPSQTQPSSPSSAAPQSQPTPEQPPASQQTPQSQNPDNSPNTPPGANTPQSGTPGSATPGAAPNSGAAPGAAASDTQTFTGTIVKQGSKYVLQDASGKSYDIDHQPEVAKFEGKRVRVRGTLDQTGNKIMVK